MTFKPAAAGSIRVPQDGFGAPAKTFLLAIGRLPSPASNYTRRRAPAMKQKKKVKSRRRSIHTGDITREIAMARAAGRVHGPFMTTCSACGRRYWPDRKEEHLEVCGKPEVQP